jgi:hypothetical protein
MARKKKIKELCFCLIPAIVGILMIVISIATAFSENEGIYKEASWVFFWVFLGLVLIAHTTMSVIVACKRE